MAQCENFQEQKVKAHLQQDALLRCRASRIEIRPERGLPLQGNVVHDVALQKRLALPQNRINKNQSNQVFFENLEPKTPNRCQNDKQLLALNPGANRTCIFPQPHHSVVANTGRKREVSQIMLLQNKASIAGARHCQQVLSLSQNANQALLQQLQHATTHKTCIAEVF